MLQKMTLNVKKNIFKGTMEEFGDKEQVNEPPRKRRKIVKGQPKASVIPQLSNEVKSYTVGKKMTQNFP